MAKRNHKFLDFILYGGVTKEEYKKIKPIILYDNFRVWKIYSIILSVAFIALFAFTLLLPDYFTYEVSSPAYVADGAEKFALSYGIASVYCIILAFSFWTFAKKSPMYIQIIIALTNVALTVFFALIPTTLDAGSLSVLFCTAIIAACLVTVRTPLKTIGLVLPVLTVFILFVCFGRERNIPDVFSDDIIYGTFVSIIAIVFGIFFNHIRIKDFNLRVYVEEQRDVDSLTGARSKLAYDREVQHIMEKLYQNSTCEPFALVIFDVNGLKITNDTYGHELGDELLIRAAELIRDHFTNSSVYRIGGDEFAVFVRNEDYENRNEIIRKFRSRIVDIHDESTSLLEDVPIACGMATYDPENDVDFISIFSRADTIMYEDKRLIKSRNIYLKRKTTDEN